MIRTIRRNIQRNYAAGVFAGVEIKGRTLVNLLGKDGNFEALTGNGFAVTGGTVVLDAVNYRYGIYGVKHTITSTQVQYYKNQTLYAGKYYILLADTKNIDAATGTRMRLGTGNVTSYYTSTSWGTLYKKLNQVSDGSVEINIECGGSAGQTGCFDGLRLYELKDGDFGLTAAQQYAKIDVDPEWTGDKLAAKFPYVDSVQFKTNTMVNCKGKNLIPKFNFGEWTLHANAVVNGDYSLTLNATASNQVSVVLINALPNTTYRISFDKCEKYWYKHEFSSAGELIAGTGGIYQNTSQTFTTTATTTKIGIYLTNYTSTGTFVFKDFQLELGSAATTFEPQIKSSAHIPIPIAQDESVWVTPGATIYKKVWEKNVVLDGNLGWTFYFDKVGFKNVKIPAYHTDAGSNSSTEQIISAPNGSILPPKDLDTVNSFVQVSGSLYLSIADSDSGWTESMTPTTAEIKAYFYGWRMCDASGNAYVSGTKYWKKITDGTGITSTLPTATYSGYTPYTLHYKLATPVYHINYIDNDLSKPILSPGSTFGIPIGIAQVEQQTGISWPAKTDQTNKYASTVPMDTQISNPTIPTYAETFDQQNVGLFSFPALDKQAFIATDRVGQATII